MTYKKIITHPNRFHADEVLAIATVFHFYGPLEVERKFKISDEEFDNPEILIIDIGRKFDEPTSNFDHHQDASLPASNILILNHFCKEKKIGEYLKKYLFWYVSEVDLGHIIESNRNMEYQTPSFSSMIRRLNQYTDGFERAITLAMGVLESFVFSAQKSIQEEAKWATLEFLLGMAIQHDTEEITNWKEWAERDDILLLISPNNRGGYQIISRDSEVLQIPIHPDQTFRHNTGFLAVYPNCETALKHAKQILHC